MKTVVNLLMEFGALSDTKVRRGGSLSPDDDARWQELKAFYDHLMTQTGLVLPDHEAPFSEEMLRRSLGEYDRLRVPINVCAILRLEELCVDARIVNLSRGGVFVAAKTLLPAGSRPTLHLPEFPETSDAILAVETEVTWCTEGGIREARLPRGMGLRFTEPSESNRDRIAALLLTTVEERLSGLW
jgi:Tfp pilus assembly protein PilZ